MKENWEKLIVLLAKMVKMYTEILQLSRLKSAAIIAADMKEIEALTQKEELLIAQVRKLETARTKIMREIASDCGREIEGLTLAKLLELAEPEIASQLTKFSEEFNTIIRELTLVNQLNTDLIQQALGYVNYNINLLSQSVTGPTYAPQGQNNDGSRVFRLLDRKV